MVQPALDFTPFVGADHIGDRIEAPGHPDLAIVVEDVTGSVTFATDKAAKRWTSPDLQGAEKCVVKKGGTRGACVTPRGAVLVEPK